MDIGSTEVQVHVSMKGSNGRDGFVSHNTLKLGVRLAVAMQLMYCS